MERDEFKKLMMSQIKLSCPYKYGTKERELFFQDYESKLNYLYAHCLSKKDVSPEEINATARVFKEGMRFQARVNNLERYVESKKKVFGSE